MAKSFAEDGNSSGKGYFREVAEMLEDILATIGFEVARVRAESKSKVVR
ncbi:MAG: hypothetical protein RLN85_12550 [Pseudomonadales bacterium]